jgi:hypothetical protein
MDRRKGDPVVVWHGVLEGINAVRDTGLTNMLDRSAVAQLAGDRGHLATRDWIKANPTVYAEGIFRGFVAEVEVEIDWNAPLIDEDNNLHHDGYTGAEDGDDDDRADSGRA